MRPHNLGFAVALAVSAAACSGRMKASMPSPAAVGMTALDIPAPPVRTLVPVPIEVPDPPAPPPPTSAASSRPAAPARPTAPPSTAAPPPAAATAPTPSEPAPVLQSSANVALIEQRTNQVLAAAQKDLDRLQVATLGANSRAQYEQARGFIKMAQEALKIKNYMYAEQLANKAAAVAALLVK